MAENSKIEWTDHTFNPWMGCTKVSPACANCYAERDFDHRYGKVKWGPSGTRVLTSDANWKKPEQWNREAAKLGVRYRVFCASLADVFEEWNGPISDSKGSKVYWSHSRQPHEPRYHWISEETTAGGECPVNMNAVRDRLFDLIDRTPKLDWLLLTKRPENIPLMWPIHPSGRHQEDVSFRDAYRRDNVWLGTSVESAEYLPRIDTLKQYGDLAPVLFLSCEPVVGPMPTLGDHIDGIDWVITGGESGPSARPADANWFRSLRDQCETAGVPFHFKQWGEFDDRQFRVGKKQAGRLLDGTTHDGMPLLYS